MVSAERTTLPPRPIQAIRRLPQRRAISPQPLPIAVVRSIAPSPVTTRSCAGQPPDLVPRAWPADRSLLENLRLGESQPGQSPIHLPRLHRAIWRNPNRTACFSTERQPAHSSARPARNPAVANPFLRAVHPGRSARAQQRVLHIHGDDDHTVRRWFFPRRTDFRQPDPSLSPCDD